MTPQEKFDRLNPLLETYKKDSLTLELREFGYFIILSNGDVFKKGLNLPNELNLYFGVKKS